jgi:hypothetical protein
MTTSVHARRRRTMIGAALAAVGLLLTGAVTMVGAATLADSRAGRDVTSGGAAQLSLPATPTALLAVVDDGGVLTSVVAMVLDPSGVGGSIVVVPPTSDSSFARSGEVFPIAETLAFSGAAEFLSEMEAMTAISFDVAEVATADRLGELLAPLGAVDLTTPPSLPTDAPVGAGQSVSLTVSEAVAVLTARTADGSDHLLDPLRSVVWTALASNVGAGTHAAPRRQAGEAPGPPDLDDFMDHLFSGQLRVRDLQADIPESDQNPRGVDAVLLDRAELLLVFAQIAPSKVAAPNPSLTFRIESRFTDEQLAGYEVNNADLVRDVIRVLLFLQANVISVDTSSGGAPAVTESYVADPTLVDQVEEGWSILFGEVTVSPAEARIPGVDATVILGESYLVLRDERITADRANSGNTPEEEETNR